MGEVVPARAARAALKPSHSTTRSDLRPGPHGTTQLSARCLSCPAACCIKQCCHVTAADGVPCRHGLPYKPSFCSYHWHARFCWKGMLHMRQYCRKHALGHWHLGQRHADSSRDHAEARLTTSVRIRDVSLCSTWGAQNRARNRHAPCMAKAGSRCRGSGQCSVPWYLPQ